MEKYIKLILDKLSLTEDFVLRKAWGGSRPILAGEFLEAVMRGLSAKELGVEFSCSETTISRIAIRHFPRSRGNTTCTLKLALLKEVGYRYCSSCSDIRLEDDFYSKTRICKTCDSRKSSHRSSLYRARKLNRTPSWANIDKIKEFYLNTPQGYQVDHIVPLAGKTVCGLHVEYNLQYLTPTDNRVKNNKFGE